MARLGGVSVGGKSPVRVMGILNASPESFYKKSVRTGRAAMREAAALMRDEGADFIDIGGMSTAPYLQTAVPEETESARVLEAVRAVRDATDLPISVDTCRAGVARASMEEGVRIINDISGLKHDRDMPRTVSRFGASVVLCAYGGGARARAATGGAVDAARRLLGESLEIAGDAGIPRQKIVLDPAIGFFRRAAPGGGNAFLTRIRSDRVRRDLAVIGNLDAVRHEGLPVLVSVSNKSFLGDLLGREDPAGRLYGSIAAEAVSVISGADIVRTHNVGQTRDAVTVASGVAGRPPGRPSKAR